jgi:predicted nucleotidyltransferase
MNIPQPARYNRPNMKADNRTMEGIRAHTHEQRRLVIDSLIPRIQEKFGQSFIAMAADGSYARNQDLPYSDLELIVFLNREQDWSLRQIVDGMLTVAIAETRQSYIDKYLEVTDIWYASGAGKLKPLVNAEFVAEINAFRPERVREKCLVQAVRRWPLYQEITAKTLNLAHAQDAEGIALTVPQTVKELLVILAFINATPYVTLGSYITQASGFTIKPAGFDRLMSLFTEGGYRDPNETEAAVTETFAGMEALMRDAGITDLYPSSHTS